MKVIAKNKRAIFDYLIERKVTAGVVLSGAEAKAARGGLVSMKGSFAHIKNGELWLFNAHISPYPHASNQTSYEPEQTRKLLVSRRELKHLQADKDAGRSIVPIAMLAGKYIKIELGVGKGKKKHDKRQTIMERDVMRSAARDLKRGP